MFIRTLTIIITFLFFTVVSANFQYNKLGVGGCKLKCGDQNGNNSLKKETPSIEGYYWRDFDGNIPKDAFPAYDVGKPTTPKTYVGLVYNKNDNSLYTSTIVEGLNYVLVVTKEKVIKTSEFIQILCTQEPDKFEWVQLSDGIIIDGPVQGGRDNETHAQKYISRSKANGISYASSVIDRYSNMSFATIDGNSREIEFYHYEVLNYNNDTSKSSLRKSQESRKAFFSHYLDYSRNPKSTNIIPDYYGKIKIGSCSFICTNRNPSKMDQSHQNSYYYWKPIDFPFTKDGFVIGKDYSGRDDYLGQSASSFGFDVGAIATDHINIVYGRTTNHLWHGKVLASVNQEKFKWVPSNTTHFDTMDKSNMIRGGLLPNGTKTYVGRFHNGYSYVPASIRLSNGSAWIWGYYKVGDSTSNDFDVFTFNG